MYLTITMDDGNEIIVDIENHEEFMKDPILYINNSLFEKGYEAFE